jgi:hypothetical protein
VLIERLQVDDGYLEMSLPTLAGVQKIEGIQLRLSGQLAADRLQAQLQQAAAHIAPANVDLQTLRGGIEVLTDRVQVDDLHLQIGNTQLTAAGVLPWTRQETNFYVHLQPLDVGEVGRLSQVAALRGQMNVSLKAEGPPEALALRGQIDAQKGRVTLQGEIDRVATPVRYRGTLDIVELDLTTAIERAALQSNLDLHARLVGAGLTLSEWRGEVLVEVEPSHL